MKEDLYNKLRLKCWDYTIDEFGYAYIFNKRASRNKKYIFGLNLFGLVVPIIVGGVAIGYGANKLILQKAITIAMPFTIIQFVISFIAILGKWDDQLAYSYEALQSHNILYNKIKKIAEFPPSDYNDFQSEFYTIEGEINGRNQQDLKYNVAEWEERMGMRSALREMQRECVECKKIPVSIESTDCPVCGKFSFKYQLKF